MQYTDYISPWAPADFQRYQRYLEFRKQRDKFLKSLQETSYTDWKIDKTLVEAGGLGKTVYIYPARGGGKSLLDLERIAELIEEGRDVRVVTLKKPDSKPSNIEKIKESVIDWDLYSREHQAMYEEIDALIAHQLCKDVLDQRTRQGLWITTTCPDPYIYSPKTYTDWAMRSFLLNPTYGIMYKKDDVYFGGVACP